MNLFSFVQSFVEIEKSEMNSNDSFEIHQRSKQRLLVTINKSLDLHRNFFLSIDSLDEVVLEIIAPFLVQNVLNASDESTFHSGRSYR